MTTREWKHAENRTYFHGSEKLYKSTHNPLAPHTTPLGLASSVNLVSADPILLETPLT